MECAHLFIIATYPGLGAGAGADANSPQDSGFVGAGGALWDGEEVTEGAGGGAIFTPPGGGGRRPPPLALTLGLLLPSEPSFFYNIIKSNVIIGYASRKLICSINSGFITWVVPEKSKPNTLFFS